MTLTDRIKLIESNAERDPNAVRRFIEGIMCGGVKLNGQPVIFTYADMQELFQRAGIAHDRFEELCQIADYSVR